MLAAVALVPTAGGGPEHNDVLTAAARSVRAGGAWTGTNSSTGIASRPSGPTSTGYPLPAPPVRDRLASLEAKLAELVREHPGRAWYAVDEFAELVGKAAFTVREWCRHGRIRAEKQEGGRGSHSAWVISRGELDRYRAEGLIAVPGK